ncbi:MAG: DegV family protein [Eubacteriales bacterium]|nr:DegV family protein [Eubacteriales bacterium]
MGYVIVTDSVLDIEEDFLFQNGICTVPLSFTIEGWDTVEDDFGRTVSFSDFYQQLRDGKLITTAQAQLADFNSVFEGILKSKRDVVYLGLSSGLSGHYRIGCVAAEELRGRYRNQIYCVDTLAVSGGQTLFVREAARRKAEGMDAEQLVEWAEQFRGHIVHSLLVDDVKYLQRCGDLEQKNSLFGPRTGYCQLLHITRNGVLAQNKKVRGRKKALELLAKQTAAQLSAGDEVYISHANCVQDAQELAEYLVEHTEAKHVEYHMLNEIVGAHTGPGAVGVFFYQGEMGE